MNGSTESDNEGSVEVCVDGRWGTVQTSQPRELAEAVAGTITENPYLPVQSWVRTGDQYNHVHGCDTQAHSMATDAQSQCNTVM